VKTIKTPEVHERLRQNAVEPAPSTREELAAFIRTEIAKWRKVAKSAGISVEY
jgi:tripartite-type tricarboxylate transporter receptor subunit TctC